MPPNESDHIQALKNQFIERKRALDAKHREMLRQIQEESRELETWVKTLGDLQTVLPKLVSGEPVVVEPSTSKIPISELIDRYFAEGKDECTAADIKRYIAGAGYAPTNATYNSIHENLRRRVERGEMVKDGPKFRKKSA